MLLECAPAAVRSVPHGHGAQRTLEDLQARQPEILSEAKLLKTSSRRRSGCRGPPGAPTGIYLTQSRKSALRMASVAHARAAFSFDARFGIFRPP